MKSEVKNLVHKSSLLENAQSDGLSKMEQMEKDLSEQRLLVGQFEAKMKSTAESMQEVEAKKRQLEEHVSKHKGRKNQRFRKGWGNSDFIESCP